MTVHLGVEWPDEPGDEAAEARVDGDSLRAWVVSGKRRFTLHPGRRSGSNVEARRLLVEYGRPDGADSTWGHLVAALQRQAVHNALAGLRREDREVLTLAFLQGHTNGEIASMLSVSVRTVGRRLSTALARLEANVRNTGARLAALPVLWLSFFNRRQAAFAALADLIRSPQAVTVAAAATAVVVGYAAMHTAAPATAARPAHQVAQSVLPRVPFAGLSTKSGVQQPAAPAVVTAVTDVHGHVKTTKAAENQSTSPSTTTTHGCGGNPTDAPPVTPVRSHGAGSPVTHPGPGGCGPHAR